MDGISASLASASTLLASTEASSEIQTKVLNKALEQAEDSLVPLLEGLGKNVDVTA